MYCINLYNSMFVARKKYTLYKINLEKACQPACWCTNWAISPWENAISANVQNADNFRFTFLIIIRYSSFIHTAILQIIHNKSQQVNSTWKTVLITFANWNTKTSNPKGSQNFIMLTEAMLTKLRKICFT